MFEHLGNNIIVMIVTYILAIILWIVSGKITDLKKKAIIRASIVFLVFPIVYIGHPFFYFPAWVVPIMSIEYFGIQSMMIMGVFGAAWALFIWVALFILKRSKSK